MGQRIGGPAHPDWETISNYDGSSVVLRLADGYNGSPSAMQVARSKMYAIPGAGGVYATAGDLAAFAHAVFEGGLIAKTSAKHMTTVSPGHETHYALGWVVKTRDGRRVFSHTGGTNGFVTSLECYPDLKMSIIILSNFGFTNMGELRSRVAKRVFGN